MPQQMLLAFPEISICQKLGAYKLLPQTLQVPESAQHQYQLQLLLLRCTHKCHFHMNADGLVQRAVILASRC